MMKRKRVELPDDFDDYGRYAKLRRWLYGLRKAASGCEDATPKKLKSWAELSVGRKKALSTHREKSTDRRCREARG